VGVGGFKSTPPPPPPPPLDSGVYFINEFGFKRLFLNPIIFGFYPHLGGFESVNKVTLLIRDAFVTSPYIRNCEANDFKVYALESTGEDTGLIHWINMTGAQAVSEDPDFFLKVFCVNNLEFNWFTVGLEFTSLSQVQVYVRE